MQKVIPIGYYFYWSPVDGEWEQLEDRVLLGTSNSYKANSTGGEATHKLSVNEMPQYNHNIPNNRLILYTDNSKVI